ncbi:MAG TPA: trehalose-phosphatase [Burkholderiaceae bacterium]
MQALPDIGAHSALFLDFDGTLAELAPQPDAVRVPPGTVALLGALQARLGGALAILTGRPVEDIDLLLPTLCLAVAGEHGALLRWADGRRQNLAPNTAATPGNALADVVQAAAAVAALHPALVLERKPAGVALHYRHAPALQALCRATLAQAIAAAPGLELLEGKCVVEAKQRGVDKGRALTALMAQPPFAGRMPLFAGDDVTDEPAIAAAQHLGGLGIKVGPGATAARLRLPGPAAVHTWLASALHAPLAS